MYITNLQHHLNCSQWLPLQENKEQALFCTSISIKSRPPRWRSKRHLTLCLRRTFWCQLICFKNIQVIWTKCTHLFIIFLPARYFWILTWNSCLGIHWSYCLVKNPTKSLTYPDLTVISLKEKTIQYKTNFIWWFTRVDLSGWTQMVSKEKME